MNLAAVSSPPGSKTNYFRSSLGEWAIYPEYLTDVKIMVCPSDANADGEELSNTVQVYATGDPYQVSQWDLSTKERREYAVATMLERGYSYGYFGWVAVDNSSWYGYATAWQSVGVPCRNAYANSNEACTALLGDLTIPSDTFNQPFNISNLSFDVNPVPICIGAGGGNKVYRLKEGIERFMITDINNPAGSAMAQSTIPAYMDGISTPERPNGVVRSVSAWIPRFNHVPGGSNVLYMNGHVEFLKFPGKFPTTKFITIYGQLGAGNTSMNSTPFSLSGF